MNSFFGGYDRTSIARPVMQYLQTPHTMSVGLCRQGSFLIQFTCRTPGMSEWYLLEFNGPKHQPPHIDSPYEFMFDLYADMEERLATLDVEWFSEDKAAETIAEFFPHHLPKTPFPRLQHKVERLLLRRKDQI